MHPWERDLDDEIRGHLALSIKDRIERGEDPDTARSEALRELGYIPAVRDSMRRVWSSRGFDAAAQFGQELRIAFRSAVRSRGLAATIVLTLALGIGANAAIFSVVRGVLLRPLVNRDEDRLVYIRQAAPSIGSPNTMFSVPEIDDFKARARTIVAFGDFSTIDFPMIGFGEPRVVMAGVVGGHYFDVMGLRPIAGRLLDECDDGPDASPVAVLTYRFWSTQLGRDPGVVGRLVRLGTTTVTVIGVLEPSLPYPDDTELIANVVTSPHHLGATMVTLRTHRMTELFGRLAPGVSIDDARRELSAIHAAMIQEHPDAYPPGGRVDLRVTPLREQLTAPARTLLFVLLAAAAVVFVIACSNVANLILARSVRREGELAVRAALGASRGALRRTLLAESLVLCGAGAAIGVAIARPILAVVSSFVGRFTVRALDVTVDSTLLWTGASLAIVAAVLLAYVPRLPPSGGALATGSVRITPAATRRLRAFAVTQIACSFVLLVGAGTLVAAVIALQRAHTGFNADQVLAVDVPLALDTAPARAVTFYREAVHRIARLPGVERAVAGSFVPWRDAGTPLIPFPFTIDHPARPGNEHGRPYARLRNVTPGFFAALDVPILAGRDFTDEDRAGSERVVIVSESVALRMFRTAGAAIDHTFRWTDPVMGHREARRIVGVAADVDDENVLPGPALTVYHPLAQVAGGGRLFVKTSGDPYALVRPITRVIRQLSPEQPVDRAATLADVRAGVLAPERINALVVSAFAGIALLIAAVGVAGVLGFSVKARTREFGVRLAMGSTRRDLLMRVMSEGTVLVTIGIAVGAAVAYVCTLLVVRQVTNATMPNALAIAAAAVVLGATAVAASLWPAVRASQVDVLQALNE